MDKLATWISHCAYVDVFVCWHYHYHHYHYHLASRYAVVISWANSYAKWHLCHALHIPGDMIWLPSCENLFVALFSGFPRFLFSLFFFLVLVFVWELSWVDSLPDEDDRHSPRPFDKLLSLFISGWQWTFIIGDLCFICWQFSFWPTNCLT